MATPSPQIRPWHRRFTFIDEPQLRKIIDIETFFGALRDNGGGPLAVLERCSFGISALDAAMRIRERGEPPQRRIEEPDAAAKRSPFEMVIRGSELNESLQELLDVGFSNEPQLLPRLMSLPELQGIEVFDAAEEMRAEIGFHLP